MISHKGYILQKKNLTEQQIKNIKKDLTLKPITNKDYSFGINFIKYYRENSNEIIVPKYYGIDNFGRLNFTENKSLKKKELKVSDSFSIRENQKEMIEMALQKLYDREGVVISLGTGFGKTVISLYILSVLSKKYPIRPLIIVNKIPLMTQWVERINQFMPECSVGFIQGKTFDTSKDITVAMLHTISLKKEDIRDYSIFNCIILDEAHHTPSAEFSNILFKTCGRFTIGLSATPERKDGLTKALEWGIGDIIKIKNEEVRKCLVKCYDFDFKIDKKYLFNGKLNMANAVTELANNRQRTLKIKDIISDLYTDKQRKILVLSDRISLLQDLFKLLPEKDFERGLYIGKMKKIELDNSASKRIILASFSIFSEGIDIPELNSIVLCTPKSDIIQVSGRIFRKKHDISPIIVDIVDKVDDIFISQSIKRKRFYRTSKFVILNSGIQDEESENEDITDILTKCCIDSDSE